MDFQHKSRKMLPVHLNIWLATQIIGWGLVMSPDPALTRVSFLSLPRLHLGRGGRMSSEAYLSIVKGLPHRLRVMRMYRYGLRELLNWSANRHEWYPRAHALRAEFEATKGLTDRGQINKAVDLGEELISRFRHWEPVLRPEVPGGTAYSINPEHPRNMRVLVNWDQLDPAKRGDWM